MDQSGKITRREILKRSGAALGTGIFSPALADENVQMLKSFNKKSKVIVVGAGAFGGWTALSLLQKGYDVTLIDQFGPGNNQSSSGGETRLIRAFYEKQIYFDLTVRSMKLWKEHEEKSGRKFFFQNGLLLFNYKSTTPELEKAWPMYRKANLPLEKINLSEASKRWPQLNTDGLDHVIYDSQAGYLEARNGCISVVDRFVKEGGKIIQQKVVKENKASGKISSVTLNDGKTLEADTFIFACGPWLTKLFPELTRKLKVTRALCFFFASPSGQSDLMENKLPNWMDRDLDGPFRSFGVPGSSYRGFKIGLTPPVNNNVTDRFDTYDRNTTEEELQLAKQVLNKRFKGMNDQPVIEQRVCQYTITPDSDFILDTHPEASNLWLLGGDSGHGYKLGPALGELASEIVTGSKRKVPDFELKRLL
jgi:glycine/D-amino acid oxidase-like deaminating enzyme